MDSFEIKINNIKRQKVKAIQRNRKMASLFRLIEICVFLIIVSKFTNQIPGAVKNSGEYFKDFSEKIVSPWFVFLIGNVIVITLFAKSGQFSLQDSCTNNSKDNLYDEFVQKSSKSVNVYQVVEYEHDQYEHKEKDIVCEEKKQAMNLYRRTQSEKFDSDKSCKQKLRRSDTEKIKRITNTDEEIPYPEDNLSNDEFRSTIEAFIERQKRFRREEEITVI